MLLKTRGIVLHHLKYSESSLIVWIYTEKSGLKSFIFKGVRKKGSKTRPAIFQPLTMVEMDVYDNNREGLKMVKEIRIEKQLPALYEDMNKNAISLFMAEVLYKSLKEEESNSVLFNFLTNAIEMLNKTSESVTNFPLIFLLSLSKYLGFFPRKEVGGNPVVFDLEEGVFRTNSAGHPHVIEYEECSALLKLLPITFSESSGIVIQPEIRIILLEKLILYYKIHLPGMSEIKSHQVLHEVFH